MWQFFKKLNIEIPYDPAIPLLSIHPKELNEHSGSKRWGAPMFTVALSTIVKRWKPPMHLSTDEWINKAFPYSGILFSHKKE